MPSALSASWAFLRPAWGGAWGALLLAAATSAGALVLAARGADLDGWLAAPLLTIAVLACRGSLWRIALDEGRCGPAGLQLGAVEVRLALVWLLGAVFLSILASLVLVVFLCFAYAVASTGAGFAGARVATWAASIEPRGRVVLGIVGAIGVAALAWAAARSSLASAATVASGRVQVLSTWPRARGAAWRILLARLIVSAPAAGLVAGAWQVSRRGPLLAFAMAAVAVGVWLPMHVGLMAYFHARLPGPPGRTP